MTVVTSRPGRLRVFANAVQWVLVINLAVTVLLMVRPEYQGLMAFSGLDIDAESDRFAGMWGNANQAGLVSLMVLVLSRWASRWHGRIGRLCGLTIIYLTASRTATWILVTLLVLYLGFAASRKVRLNALALALTLAAGAFFALRVTGNSLESLAAGNPNIARVLDVTEAKNEEAGMGSRRQVFVKWLGMVPSEPWYGFGLYTLNGGDSPEAPVRPELPSYGPHNLYLGIVLDVGWVGLASFLGVVLYQLMVIRRTWLVPASRHAMFALCLVVLVFSNFNHNMLTEYAGWIGFSLMFLLPSSPALEGQRYGDPTIDRR
jgi:O-antigen ligase